MKTLRFVLATVAALGSVSVFATNARVESMGKNPTFIMDDISIFDNPANINLYPNFLIGELGTYVKDVPSGVNEDPNDPWFGGIFSLGIGENKALSIAGVFNRKDERLFKYFPDFIAKKGCYNANGEAASATCTERAPTPITNFDGFLGANINNIALGLHIYVAHQDGLDGDMKLSNNAFVSALQLDAGTNIEISSNYSFEFAFGGARLQYGPEDRGFFDEGLFSSFARTRLFKKIDAINGHWIPAAAVKFMNAPGRDEIDVSFGSGADAAFDRGFFWIGLEFFYNRERAGNSWFKDINGESVYVSTENDYGRDGRSELWKTGGTISFGIERNIWWDWFVIRVGGKKNIAYADYEGSKESILCPSKRGAGCQNGNYFETNQINDGSRDDHVGFGIGINIEEKLKIDATVAEDLVFRNPFQGGGRLMSRVSATYSF